MDFKKLAGQAGQLLTRAVQYTEEKFGSAEKTEFDGHYDSLVQQCDSIKLWTEKIMNGAEAVIIPNPGNRVEDMLYEKIEKRRPNRLSNLEYLGLDMVQAGNEFGSGTVYGSVLLKVGGTQQRLGLIERDFINNAIDVFIQPLHKFLDTEMKTISRERRTLDNKRLDLDVCKNRLKKAKTSDSESATKNATDSKAVVSQAESEVQKTQSEFDRQTEITKLLLEGVRSSQASHLRHLIQYVEAQANYYEKCKEVMQELQTELSQLEINENENGTNPTSLYPTLKVTDHDINASDWRRAKVVCDYTAANSGEISLTMNEEIKYADEDRSKDFVRVQKGAVIGIVPRAYIEPMDD